MQRKVRRGYRRVLSPTHRSRAAETRRIGEQVSSAAAGSSRSSRDFSVPDCYVKSADLAQEASIPLIWWTDAPNFGDLLAPWLAARMTRLPARYPRPKSHNYVAVGSIVGRANRRSTVWGSGSFGTERRSAFCSHARYTAVRGPLTRSRLNDVGIACPPVYGDPALLVPWYFNPRPTQAHEVGVIIRHSEHNWRQLELSPEIKVIDLGSGDVEAVIEQIVSCRRILSSSLHGLVLADTFGIPNAWLDTSTSSGGSRPNGGEFKFYDYFASVSKLRHPVRLDLSGAVDVSRLNREIDFDDRPIQFDPHELLAACPFVERRV